MLASAVVALAVQAPDPTGDSATSAPRIHLLAGEPLATNPTRWPRILDILPHLVHVTGPDAAGTDIAEIAAEMARRQQESGAAPPCSC